MRLVRGWNLLVVGASLFLAAPLGGQESQARREARAAGAEAGAEADEGGEVKSSSKYEHLLMSAVLLNQD